MNKVLVLSCVVFGSYSTIYAQDNKGNAQAYDNVQHDKERSEQLKPVSYKQVARSVDDKNDNVRPELRGNAQPVKSLNPYAKPSAFKPLPGPAQPQPQLMKQQVAPSAQPVMPISPNQAGQPSQPGQRMQQVQIPH